MSKFRILQKGASTLSQNREVILVASSIIGTAALMELLPERLHWGMSEAGNIASDTPDSKPNEREELLDIILLDNPDIEPMSQITDQECGIARDMSFGEAFNHARSMLGGGAVFAWHGKLYNTFFREEWSALSPEDRQEFMNSIDFSYVPEDEIPPLPEPDLNGVSKYARSPLNYPDDDAALFYNWLVGKGGAGVKPENITLLLDEKATSQAILQAMNTQFAKANAEDAIIFFFSGHGDRGVFLSYGSDRDGSYLQHADVKTAFKASAAKTKLCFADACHSGTLTPNLDKYKGIKFAESAVKDFDTNIAVMMSSRSSEVSIESSELKQGAFTYYLVKGLKGAADVIVDKKITMGELFTYISKNIVFFTKGEQHPILTGKFDRKMILVKN